MQRDTIQNKKWLVAVVLMFCIAFYSSIFLKFDQIITWVITLIVGAGLVALGERITRYQSKEKDSEVYLLWGIGTVLILTLVMYLIESGSYITQQSYGVWLKQIFLNSVPQIEFEIGTLILSDYIIILIVYGREIWGLAKQNLNQWLPSFWYLVIGIGVVIYIKERTEHLTVLLMILGVGALLIGYLIFKYISNREQSIVYRLSDKRYLITFLSCLSLVIVVGTMIPDFQDLPGARWMRKTISTFSGGTTLQSKVPKEIQLNNEFPLSEAVLFEVIASEPLYLRNMAYSHYEDGEWSIAYQDEALDSYIVLKPQYLQAEYAQTKSLLDEIVFQNSQNNSILPSYAEIATYEESISHKKKYTVIQNPINKINYLTVNGVTNISDPNSEIIYYYNNINDCYFYGEQIVEPSQYTVEYYDHVPKTGSKEYMLLRNMNSITWESIYRKVAKNRLTYDYYYDDMPKLLLTYTPLVQYKNAKRDYLQVPQELKEPLRALTKTITLSRHSDWANAEAICNYLKNNYTYQLHSKQNKEEEHIYQFLFESKEGICQEFASSMVLMCRSIGIPAKYVTGYLASEKDPETGRYIVREKDAHAFVEVYIAGYGWMTFDPTPTSTIDTLQAIESIEWDLEDYLNMIWMILVLGGCVFLFKGGYLYIQEIIWGMVLYFETPCKQIECLFKRTNKWLEYNGYTRLRHETLSKYTERLEVEELEISKITKLYEAYKYGNQVADKEQFRGAYEQYKNLKTKLKNK